MEKLTAEEKSAIAYTFFFAESLLIKRDRDWEELDRITFYMEVDFIWEKSHSFCFNAPFYHETWEIPNDFIDRHQINITIGMPLWQAMTLIGEAARKDEGKNR